MRNTLPFDASQKPSTTHCLAPSVVSNTPRKDASVNGFSARAPSTLAATSMKSYACTRDDDWLNTTTGASRLLVVLQLDSAMTARVMNNAWRVVRVRPVRRRTLRDSAGVSHPPWCGSEIPDAAMSATP